MFDKLRAKIQGRTPDQEAIHQKLRQLMIGLNVRGAHAEQAKDLRRLALMLAKAAAKPGALGGALDGMGDVEAFHVVETASWLSPEQIAEGMSGPFEACGLMSWLEIAKKAGVEAVPAKVILRLSDAETEAASGLVQMPTGAIPDRIRKRLATAIARDGDLSEMLTAEPERDAPVDMEVLVEKLHACLDDVEPNTVVRSNQCGASTLKTLAGTGLVDDTAPEVSFGRDLEIGPGWIRNGNRRRVDVADRRLGEAYVAGAHTGMIMVARPWIKASRFIEGRDPHRAGTPFDVPGKWAAEWRVFIKDGKAIGVASYYGWADSATPHTARIAVEARDLAQRIVDVAVAQGLEPRYASTEHARRNPQIAEMLETTGFGVGTFNATIDFIETDRGLLMLEAGPCAGPLGGGHPCAFAGCGGQPTMGNPPRTEGVAFRIMDHVLMAEPKTWVDGDRTDRILEWDDVEALAKSDIS